MANTTNGLPYPIGTDRVMDGDDSIKALAQALDPAVLLAGTIAPAIGWSMQRVVAYKMGPLCVVQGLVTRTGALIAGGAIGNLPDAQVLTGVPAAWQAPDRIYCATFSSNTKTFFGRVDGVAQATGAITVATGAPNVDIAVNDQLDVVAIWHV